MKQHTWKALCEATGLDMVDLTGSEDWAEHVEIEGIASGTVLGDEIIKELEAEGKL